MVSPNSSYNIIQNPSAPDRRYQNCDFFYLTVILYALLSLCKQTSDLSIGYNLISSHALVHVTDFLVVNVHVDELSSAQIWQHKMCATLSANVNINYHLPIKIYYRICTVRNIRIKVIHGSQHVF